MLDENKNLSIRIHSYLFFAVRKVIAIKTINGDRCTFIFELSQDDSTASSPVRLMDLQTTFMRTFKTFRIYRRLRKFILFHKNRISQLFPKIALN